LARGGFGQESMSPEVQAARQIVLGMTAFWGISTERARCEAKPVSRWLPMQIRGKDVLLTRRAFVAVSAMGGAALAIGCKAGRQGSWEFLSNNQARTLAAICDQIIPADDFPSASQAGVLNYIDRQLIRHYRRHQDAYRNGLEQADTMSRKRFGQGLADASPARQLEIVSAMEQQMRAFFELVRRHTLEGYYGSPRHGGNRDAVSWRMLGLTEPPVRGRAQYDLRKGSAS
jgi:gluconate 2-dehydrogenase gamma chain